MREKSITEEAETLLRIIGHDPLSSYLRARLGAGRELKTRPILVSAYAHLSPAESLPFLEDLLRDASETVETRVAAVRAVGALLDRQSLSQKDRAIRLLTACLEAAEIPIRSASASALAHLGEQSLLDKLRQMYEDGRLDVLAAESVRAFAISADRGLPLPPAGTLIGRESQLELLSRQLHQNRLVVLLGLKGIGKTALAAEFAHRSTFQKIWISAPAGMTVSEIVAEMSQPLKRKQPILAIIDNFENLPPQELMSFCKKLLANYHHIHFILVGHSRADRFEPNEILTLSPLSYRESLRLIDILLHHERQEAHQAAAKLAHGHPLTLQVIAEALSQTGDLPSERYLLERLSSGIDESLSGLSPVELATLEFVSHFESAAELNSAEDISLFTDQVIGFTPEILETLRKSGFLTGNEHSYNAPWLLRIRFRSAVDERTRLRINKRLITYFLARGDVWKALLHQEHIDGELALEILVSNVDRLISQGHAQAACSMLLRLQREDKRQGASKVALWRIPWTLGELKSLFEPLKVTLECYQNALDLAGKPSAKSILLNRIGGVLFGLGERRLAIESHRAAVQEAEGQDGADPLCRALADLATALALMGQRSEALKAGVDAVARSRKSGSFKILAYCLASLAKVSRSQEESLALFREAAALLEASEDLKLAATILTEYGGVLASVEKSQPEAAEVLRNAYSMALTTQDKDVQARAMHFMGRLSASDGYVADAIRKFDEVLAIARFRGDPNLEGSVLWDKSLALDEMGRRGDAVSCAKRALEILERLEDESTSKIRNRLRYWKV